MNLTHNSVYHALAALLIKPMQETSCMILFHDPLLLSVLAVTGRQWQMHN
jgi:hypothetical protein